MNADFFKNTLARVERGDTLRAVIVNQAAGAPIVVLFDAVLDGSYDEIRFKKGENQP